MSEFSKFFKKQYIKCHIVLNTIGSKNKKNCSLNIYLLNYVKYILSTYVWYMKSIYHLGFLRAYDIQAIDFEQFVSEQCGIRAIYLGLNNGSVITISGKLNTHTYVHTSVLAGIWYM